MSRHRFVGIDFSGDQRQWNPGVKKSNVWLATVEAHDGAMTLTGLQRVQQLPGANRPFARLAAWLAVGDYAAAAIDAPFSIPWWFFGQTFIDHPGLLAMVSVLHLPAARDFPTGTSFAQSVKSGSQFQCSKPLRVTECYWRGRGVNIRSTMWVGTRPGAPFASACIKLLAQTNRPVWPWASYEDSSLLIEAFPAAQLRHWGQPCEKYSGPSGRVNRDKIVSDLTINRGLTVGDAELATIWGNADALDAVLCAFAARAVVTEQLGVELPPFDAWQREGWIAIHK